jgi:hypothetical protein
VAAAILTNLSCSVRSIRLDVIKHSPNLPRMAQSEQICFERPSIGRGSVGGGVDQEGLRPRQLRRHPVRHVHASGGCLGGPDRGRAEGGGRQVQGGHVSLQRQLARQDNLDTEGMVKMLADTEMDRILGVHIIGQNAGEMIAEGTLAIEYGASSKDEARHNQSSAGDGVARLSGCTSR